MTNRTLVTGTAVTIALLAAWNDPAVAAGDIVLTRDAAIGARFGAPGPRKCSTRSQPTSGAPTPAQVRAYVICGYERDVQGGSESLDLVGKVAVQVARGRPYEHVRDSLESIDPHRPVYDIRGTSVVYSCGLPGGRAQPCRRTVNDNDTGKCYQTTFDEWRCTWGDFTAPMSTDTRTLVPPPSLAEAE